MPKRSSKPHDVNQLAASILQQVTQAARSQPKKNPAAVALGRLGGLKGGKVRDERLSAERKTEIARQAARIRWSVKRRRK